LLPVFAIWVFMIGLRRGGGSGVLRRLVLPALAWSALVAATTGSILLLSVGPSNLDQLYRTHASARSGDSYSHAATVKMIAANIRGDWHLFVLAVIGTLWLLLRRRYVLLIAPAWCAIALAALWRHSPVWYHHHLLLTVPGCIVAGVAIGEMLRGGFGLHWRFASVARGVLRLAAAGVAMALVLAVVTGAKRDKPKPWLFWRDQDRFVVAVMRGYGDKTSTVFTDRQMYAFRAGYRVPPNLSVTSHKRLVTGNLSGDEIARTIEQQNPEQVILSWRLPEPVKRRIISQVEGRYKLVYFGVLVYLPDREIPVRAYVRNDVSGDPLDALLRAGRLVPEAAQGHDFIGLTLANRGRRQEAITSFVRANAIDPYEPRACRHLAEAFMAGGEFAKGFSVLRTGLQTGARGRFATIARDYAWRRATCPDESLRDGAEAASLVRQVIALQEERSFRTMEVLATSLAAQGRFEQAVAAAEEALHLARSSGEEEAAVRLERELDSYRRGQPWIEPVEMPGL
jgi:hypothetical protein